MGQLSILDEMIKDRKPFGDKGELEAQVEILNKKRDELNSITQALQNDRTFERKTFKSSGTMRRKKKNYASYEMNGGACKVELYDAYKTTERPRRRNHRTIEKKVLSEEIEQLPKGKEELEKLIAEHDKTTKQLDELKEQIENHETKKKELIQQTEELKKQLVEKLKH